MKQSNISFEKFSIVPFTEKFITNSYLKWVNDYEVTEFLEIRHKKFIMADLYEYFESFKDADNKYLFAVICNLSKRHIGNTTIYDVDHVNKTFDIGYLIGEKEFWNTTAGFETLIMSLNFAFDFLKLRKFFGGVYSSHLTSRFNLSKAGFKVEAKLKEKYLHKNKLVDEVIYSLESEKWKGIKKKLKIK